MLLRATETESGCIVLTGAAGAKPATGPLVSRVDNYSRVPTTPRNHFDDDISRAWDLHALAVSAEPADAPLATDVARVAVAFGVGAMDAYLCDAFTDTLARCLKSCRNGHELPNGYAKLELPIGPLMTGYAVRENWALRMAARALMERDNLLQLGRLKELLNPALPPGHKLWNDIAQEYVDLDRKRLTGFRKSEYAALTGQAKAKAPNKASNAILTRMGEIVQRRHDIVHNCDRPKAAKQWLSLAAAKKMLADVEDFVVVLDEHLETHRLY